MKPSLILPACKKRESYMIFFNSLSQNFFVFLLCERKKTLFVYERFYVIFQCGQELDRKKNKRIIDPNAK